MCTRLFPLYAFFALTLLCLGCYTTLDVPERPYERPREDVRPIVVGGFVIDNVAPYRCRGSQACYLVVQDRSRRRFRVYYSNRDGYSCQYRRGPGVSFAPGNRLVFEARQVDRGEYSLCGPNSHVYSVRASY